MGWLLGGAVLPPAATSSPSSSIHLAAARVCKAYRQEPGQDVTESNRKQQKGTTMSDQIGDQPSHAGPSTDDRYIAHLWEYPQLTIAIFGIQAHTPEGYAVYETSGIPQQMEASLGNAEGLLGVRIFAEGNGGLQLQYWRSHEDLARFARTMPHTSWWKWLRHNQGKGFGFYHEIYQCRTAEAIFEAGTAPVGPGIFCTTSAVTGGEGRSQERQQQFLETAQP